MGYGYTQAERERRLSDWQHAAKQCPHCSAPINQQKFDAYGTDEPRRHCGATACRSAAYRQRKADRLSATRQEANDRINCYAAQLPPDQAAAVRVMRDVLMSKEPADYQHGHEQALAIIKVIEARACKHDRISVLQDNASAAKRRADEAEHYNRELQAIYQHRIAELQSELSVYQLLEGAVHNIATRQLAQQPDPQERQPAPLEAEPEDPDRAVVLATLAEAGIKPIDQALAEQDDPESDEDDDPEE